jgi:hypothetical protein
MSDQQPPGRPGPQGGGPEEHSYGRSYGQPPPGDGPPSGRQRSAPLAVAGLVTGIIGVIPCCWGVAVVSIAAILLGFLGRKQVHESGGALQGDGMAVAAIVLGAVGVLASVAYWILILTGVVDTTFYLNRD